MLWGGIKEFTELYLRLTAALAQLDFAPTAFATMDAIQPRDRSIIDVDRIKLELGTPDDDRDLVKVVGIGPGIRREAPLPRAVLCALVAELHITLKNPTWPIFDAVDLLDFPGARSREKYSNINDKAESEKDRARRPRELFIRGKIAVLFQRYTEELELTSLLLCMPGGTAEVKDLGLLVREWIFATHGETPAERREQRNALFLVLTKSDLDFIRKDGEDEESRQKRWYRRIFASMIELYQRDMWLDDWNGRPFDNALWLRNPSIEQNHLVTYKTTIRDGREVAIEPRVETGVCPYDHRRAAKAPVLFSPGPDRDPLFPGARQGLRCASDAQRRRRRLYRRAGLGGLRSRRQARADPPAPAAPGQPAGPAIRPLLRCRRAGQPG